MILVLGFKSSGKTLMLAALYQHFGFGSEPGMTLIPDDASERRLAELTKNIQTSTATACKSEKPCCTPRIRKYRSGNTESR